MDTPELEQFFESAWKSTVHSCLERLVKDKVTIRSCRTFKELKENIIEDSDSHRSEEALQELAMITPKLVALRDFGFYFADKLGPNLDPSLFWGLLALILTRALQFDNEDPMRRVTQMVRKLSRHAEIYQNQCSNGSQLSKKEKEACFEIFVGMTKFFAELAVFLREFEGVLQEPKNSDPWHPFASIFDHAIHEIDESLSGLEKMAALNNMRSQDMSWIYSFLAIGSHSFRDEAQLPCNTIPPAKHSRFFDRDEVIEEIEKHFYNKDSGGSFRSLALYGMGGVGKSHVAMKYAEKKYSRREINAVLWVAAENAIAIKQSFTDVALRLRLPNARLKAHDDNHILVMNWLQHTRSKWLIVYDNADDPDILFRYWPNSASRGQALITTRNRSLAYEPADRGLEVISWDTETGSKFLIHLLSGHISADLLASQSQSALDLSERMSGHALALASMGGIIYRRQWAIKELVDVLDSQPDFHRDAFHAMWRLSSEGLHPNASAILSVISFCNPDNIPQALFEVDSPELDLPADKSWCADAEKLSKALEELQMLCLIHRDRESRQLTVHRLVQQNFRQFLSPAGRQAAFNRSSVLLYAAFPSRDPSKAQMFDVWERCSLWVQHVIALKDGFRQELKRQGQQQPQPQSPETLDGAEFRACREFCELLVTCQRFILEQHAFPELQDMVDVNEVALETLADPADRTFDLVSSLPSHLGQMQARLGHYNKALESAVKSRNIRLQDPGADLREIAWAEHNIAQVLTTAGPLEKAVEWHRTAVKTWKAALGAPQPIDETVTGDIPPVIRTGLGRCLAMMNKLEEARPLLESAYKDLKDTKPLNWAMAASTQYAIGRLEMRCKNLETAEARFMEAQSLWLTGDKARTDHFNGACMYRMACCALDTGRVEAAFKHLHDAMIVTLVHKEYMPGEHARCLYKLSQALLMSVEEGDGASNAEAAAEEANAKEHKSIHLLREAEELYFSRVAGEGEGGVNNPNPTEDDYDALVYCLWR